MNTDMRLLRRLVGERGIKYNYLAQKMGCTKETITNKMKRDDHDWKISEIRVFIECLRLTPEEVHRIFFIYG